MVKTGRFDKIKEKQFSVFMNKWIRCPFLIIAAFLIYIGWLYSKFDMSWYVALVIGSTISYNCIHYNAESIINFEKHKNSQKINEE